MQNAVRTISSILLVVVLIVFGYLFGKQYLSTHFATKNATSKESVTVTAYLAKDNGLYLLEGDPRYQEALTIENALDDAIHAKLDANVGKKVTVQGDLVPAGSSTFYLFQLNGEMLATDASVKTPVAAASVPTLHDYLAQFSDTQRACVSKAITADKLTTLDSKSLADISIDDMKAVNGCLPTVAQ